MGFNGGVRGDINTPTASALLGRWSVREMFLAVKDESWPKVPIPFTPDALSPALWLDASDTSTITESGGAVSQWDNKGSLGNFTQASGALQPATGVSTQNGLNVINFAADYLTATNQNEWKFLHDGTNFIIATVVKYGTSINPNTVYGLMGTNQASSSLTGFAYGYDDRESISRFDRFFFAIRNGNSGQEVISVIDDYAFTPNTFQVTTLLADPDNGTTANRLTYSIDGGSDVASNTASDSVSTGNPGWPMQIGAFGNNNLPFTGSIAEIVIVSGANATSTNAAALRDYLNAKWSVY